MRVGFFLGFPSKAKRGVGNKKEKEEMSVIPFCWENVTCQFAECCPVLLWCSDITVVYKTGIHENIGVLWDVPLTFLSCEKEIV